MDGMDSHPRVDPSFRFSRQFLFTFTPSCRVYDWSAKSTIVLSPLESSELTERASTGGSCEFFHDPGMGSNRQGQLQKSLKMQPMTDGSGAPSFFSRARVCVMPVRLTLSPHRSLVASGGVFLTLLQTTGGVTNKVSVAVSLGEVAVLRHLVSYLVPRLLGFDEIFNDAGGSSGSVCGSFQSRCDGRRRGVHILLNGLRREFFFARACRARTTRVVRTH